MALNLLSMNFVRRLETSGRAGRVSGVAGVVWIAVLRMRERWPELRFEMKAGCLEFVGTLMLNPLNRLP
jgi:hypothetical protein